MIVERLSAESVFGHEIPAAPRKRGSRLWSGAAACALAAALPACAQAQAAPAAVTDAAPQGDIVVTATRDRSYASKTPIAITAVTGQQLLSAGVTNPVDLAKSVPNLEMNRYYGLQITIRGVTNSDTTAKGDPSAAFLLDGIYIARPQAQEVSFYDLDRVEVLRGPQGTLYGRNSTAGVINVISNRPTDRFEVIGNAGYGNYNAVQGDLAVNLPINDKLAVRVAGSYDRRDSYIINDPTDHISGNPFRDNRSGRISVKFDPTDTLKLLLVADYSSIRGNEQFNVDGSNFYAPVDGDPSNRVYVSGSASERLQRGFDQQLDPYTNDRTWGVMGELAWDLGPVTATYLGSYRRFDVHEETTDLLGQVSPTYTYQSFNQDSHELRLSLNDVSRLKLQVGANYFEESSHQWYDQPDYFGFDHFILDYGPTRSKSYAAFGQATYSVTDSFRLTGGVRYTHDHKDQFGLTILQSALFGDSTLVGGANVNFSKTTWRVSADYDVSRYAMLYASVATGYKSGGFNDGCEDGSTVHGLACNSPRSLDQLYYRPETLTAYEAGIKGRTPDNAVRYSLDAFFYDYKNLQLSGVTYYNGAAAQLIQNAGQAHVFGVEGELTLRPSPRNTVNVMANYLDGHYTSYLPLGAGGPDWSGRPLDRSPKSSVTAAYVYSLPLSAMASLDFSVQTKLSAAYMLSNFAAPIQYRQPSYTRTEVSVTYNAPGHRWYLQGYARNLENTVLMTALTDVSGVLAVVPSDPRTYGVRAGFKF